jgi:hypothetical protein
MADVSSAEVTILRSWSEGGTNGRNRIGLLAKIAKSGGITAGTLTNKIPASAFGLRIIESCSNLYVYTVSGGAAVTLNPASPNYDGTLVHTRAAATAAIADVVIADGNAGVVELKGYR